MWKKKIAFLSNAKLSISVTTLHGAHKVITLPEVHDVITLPVLHNVITLPVVFHVITLPGVHNVIALRWVHNVIDLTGYIMLSNYLGYIMCLLYQACIMLSHYLLASVAQSDVRPTGDQEVACSIPAESCNILAWRMIMKFFLRSSLPTIDSSILTKECAQVHVNRLKD